MARTLLLILVVAAPVLGGCVSIADESVRQLDGVGDVEVTTVVCASEAPADAMCPPANTGEITVGGEYQLLAAYRVPVRSAPPESITVADADVSLSRSSSYSAELERLAPPPAEAGQRWVGYISPPFAHRAGDAQRTATVVARFMLLRDVDGSPFAAPFRYRTIVGYRHAAGDPHRPVRCGDSLAYANPPEGTSCLTYPTEEELAEDHAVATRDLGILAGPSASVRRGETGTVPFTIAYDGGAPAPSFAVAATTTVPGGTATPGATEIAPAATGTSVVPVAVSVPATTPPGNYEVGLTATHDGRQSRHATGLLTVTGAPTADRTRPEVAMRMRTRPRLRRAVRIGIVADVSCSERCRLSAQLRAGRSAARALRLAIPRGQRWVVVGSVREPRSAAGRRNLRIRFRRGLGPRVVRVPRLRLTLAVRAKDRSGNVRRRSVGFQLRR